MNTPIVIKNLNTKFQKMELKNVTIKKDKSVKKLNFQFQNMEIGKKRKRELQISQKNTKKRKMVTDVVLYDKDFIDNLFSVMDSIKKNRKYDINPDINPDIKMEDKHFVKLIPELVHSNNNDNHDDDDDIDIDIDYDSNVEIDGYASDMEYDSINSYYNDYDY
jgi:hypothetical protein